MILHIVYIVYIGFVVVLLWGWVILISFLTDEIKYKCNIIILLLNSPSAYADIAKPTTPVHERKSNGKSFPSYFGHDNKNNRAAVIKNPKNLTNHEHLPTAKIKKPIPP